MFAVCDLTICFLTHYCNAYICLNLLNTQIFVIFPVLYGETRIVKKKKKKKKNPVDFMIKYWQLATSAFTVNFMGTSRLFTDIITHGRK